MQPAPEAAADSEPSLSSPESSILNRSQPKGQASELHHGRLRAQENFKAP